jgi:hypothetical protein
MIYILAGVRSFRSFLENILVRLQIIPRKKKKEKKVLTAKENVLQVCVICWLCFSFLGRFFGPVLRAGGRLWSWARCGRRRPKVNT